MNLLIVGGTGVLSTAVVMEALRKGIEVTVINRGNRKGRLPEGVELVQSDVVDEANIRSKLQGRRFDAVIDFICYNKKQISYSLSLFKDFADQYVFISSACVYDTSIPGIKNEDSPKGFKDWAYSTDKWEAEQYLTGKAAEMNVNYSIIRPCVTYDDTRIPYGIMPGYGYHWTVVERILNDKPVITWDGGKACWNLMHVEDFAVGVVGIVGNRAAYGQAFNICGDIPYSWNEVLDTLGTILGHEVKRLDISSAEFKSFCPGRAGEIAGRAADAVIDNSKIKSLVPGFSQKISLEDGIRRTLDAYRAQNYQKGIDWRFDAEWDYIVKKAGKGKFRTGFKNYLGSAEISDRLAFLTVYHKESFTVKMLKKLKG